jgi:hypothetical protein
MRNMPAPPEVVVTELVALRRQREGWVTAESINLQRLSQLPGKTTEFLMRDPVGDQAALDRATQSSERIILKVFSRSLFFLSFFVSFLFDAFFFLRV